MAGFTTVRDVGSEEFLDVGLRNSINAGIVPGPRMLVSVHALGAPGAIAMKAMASNSVILNHETGPKMA